MVVVCLSLTTACSSDEDEFSADNPLLGTWIYKDAALGYEDIITFKADGTCKLTVNYVYEDTNFSVKISGTYIYEDDLITIIPENGNTSSWKVESVTAQQLILTRSDLEGQPSVTYHRA